MFKNSKKKIIFAPAVSPHHHSTTLVFALKYILALRVMADKIFAMNTHLSFKLYHVIRSRFSVLRIKRRFINITRWKGRKRSSSTYHSFKCRLWLFFVIYQNENAGRMKRKKKNFGQLCVSLLLVSPLLTPIVLHSNG